MISKLHPVFIFKHLFFLWAENGEVFLCGQNHRGQLGLGHNADISTLQPCLSLTHIVTKVACGWDFTLFLTGKHQDAMLPFYTGFLRINWLPFGCCDNGTDTNIKHDVNDVMISQASQ